MVGSKIFMAPEIVEGSPHSFPCDMWSLGIILFLMLSGEYPFNFRNIDNAIVNDPILFLGPVWQGVSPLAKDLVLKMLEKHPENRITP